MYLLSAAAVFFLFLFLFLFFKPSTSCVLTHHTRTPFTQLSRSHFSVQPSLVAVWVLIYGSMANIIYAIESTPYCAIVAILVAAAMLVVLAVLLVLRERNAGTSHHAVVSRAVTCALGHSPAPPAPFAVLRSLASASLPPVFPPSRNCVCSHNCYCSPFLLVCLLWGAGDHSKVPPVIVTQPRSIIGKVGGRAEFLVEVDGSPDPTLQWYLDEYPLPGKTSARLRLQRITAEHCLGTFTVKATNAHGSVVSKPVNIDYEAVAPVITRHPMSSVAGIGDSVVFETEGKPALSLLLLLVFPWPMLLFAWFTSRLCRFSPISGG